MLSSSLGPVETTSVCLPRFSALISLVTPRRRRRLLNWMRNLPNRHNFRDAETARRSSEFPSKPEDLVNPIQEVLKFLFVSGQQLLLTVYEHEGHL